jgi:hypothetical protein
MNPVRILGVILLLLVPATVRGLEAGAAKVRLSFPPGIPLDGAADRLGRPSVGEHDGLWSRCLYLSDGEGEVYLLSLDLFAIPRGLRDRVVELGASLATAERIILTATHTPNGPGGMYTTLPMRWRAGRYHPEVLESCAEASVAAMKAAKEQKRRATLGYATARQRGLTTNSLEEDGATDEQIGVIRVDDADGKAISILACFAAMPELVPAVDRYRLSAGFPGVVCRELEALAEPGCIALYLTGAAGDQRPVDPDQNEGWARMDSIGRTLALLAKGAANDMTFYDAKLNVGYREAPLPDSLASGWLSDTAVLQTLETEGLLIAFLPGLPCVEIGLELRARAVAEGFKAQFTAGMANDSLGWFVPRGTFAAPGHAAVPNYFGPGLEDWLYAEVLSLARGEAAAPREFHGEQAGRDAVTNGEWITLRGGDFERGYQRGAAFEDDLHRLYEERVLMPVRSGQWLPAADHWPVWPSFLDPSAVALPALAAEARPRLGLAGSGLSREVEGFAEGAGLSFDAAWLLMSAQSSLGIRSGDEHLGLFLGTLFAVIGERANNGETLVAHNLAAGWLDRSAISQVEPDTGHGFVHIGPSWHPGVYTGMNDAGVVLSVERNPAMGTPQAGAVAASAYLRHWLQTCGTYGEVVEALRTATDLRGYTVVSVAPDPKGWFGALAHFGKVAVVREVQSGILTAINPQEDESSPGVLARYRELMDRLGAEGALGSAEALAALDQAARDTEESGSPWGPEVRQSVVFFPERGMLQVAFPDKDGVPGDYTEIRLKKGARRE